MKKISYEPKKTIISFKEPKPKWATWGFRIFAILTTVACFVIANDTGIANDVKVRVMVYLKGADMAILGLANMFGVKVNK